MREKISLSYITGFLVGGIFLLGGLTELRESLLGGLLIILGSLFIFPPASTFIEGMLRKKLSKKVKIGLFLVLIIVGMGIISSPQERTTANQPDYLSLAENKIVDSESSIVDAFTFLTEKNYRGAREKVLDAKSTLEEAKSYVEGAGALSNGQRNRLNAQIRLDQLQSTAVYKTSNLLEEKDKVLEEIGRTEDIEKMLPKLELLSRGFKENSGDWRELYSEFSSAKETTFPDLPDEYIESNLALADVMMSWSDMLDENIDRLKAQAPTYVSVEEKSLPTSILPEADVTGLITAELKSFFESFDSDRDNKLSIGEAQDFFFWVENNVKYRYDNEGERKPIVGTLVGDGRAGSDYRQRPLETLSEGAGDCEDMATLEQAFYQYYGIEAYVSGVNAMEPDVLDHAATIVLISGHVDEFKGYLGDLVYYEIPEGTSDVYGNPVKPGIYMLVDNSYSGALGYVSGGIAPGTFKIHCAIPLEKGYDEEWGDIVSRCGVPMD